MAVFCKRQNKAVMKIHLSDLVALFFFVRTVFTEGRFVYFADRGKVKAQVARTLRTYKDK